MIKELQITEIANCIASEYENYRESGWKYIISLRDAVDQFGRTDHAKMDLYQAVADQINRSIKTLQNKVTIARKPYSLMAYNLGLEFEHLLSVYHLADSEAEALLSEAAENFLDPAELGYIAKKRFGTYPKNGKSVTPTADAVDTFLADTEPRQDSSYREPTPSIYAGIPDDVPYDKGSIQYKDYETLADDLAGDADSIQYDSYKDDPIWRNGTVIIPLEPIEAARLLRRAFDDDDFATLVAALIG